ncbi:MAG: sugar-binding protein [Kiritimatiellia bacterium]
MSKTLIFAFGLAIFCGTALNTDAVATESVAQAVSATQPPVLDGRLDDACWQDASPLGNFHVCTDTTGRRVNDTEVRLAYDDAWLYLGVKCRNPLQKHVLDPKTREHDGPVTADESVELFLSSDGKGKVYYHFMLSCFNVKAEQRVIDGNRERLTWNLPWRSAVAVSDEGWTAEAAFPLYLLLEYGDLEHIRLNIARNRRQPYVDASNVVTHEELELSIWRPVKCSFHEPTAFGTLAPLAPEQLRIPFLASLERVDVHPYFTEGGTNYYRVELELKAGNSTTGEVEVVVIDRPVTSEETVVRKQVELLGTRPVKLTVSVPAPTPAERSITVETRVATHGEVWQQAVVEQPAVLKVMRGWLDRNYYTTEEQAVATAEIGMPESTLQNMSVAVEVDGKTLATAAAAAETAVTFDLGELAVGSYPVRIKLQSNDGTSFASVKQELIKRTPKPGCEVKIDQINRVVLKDDRPFFPIGIIMAGVQPDNEAAFKDIADAGCNTFSQWRIDLPAAIEYLDRARQYGLQVTSLLETGWLPPKDSGLVLPEKVLNEQELKELLKARKGGSVMMRMFLMNKRHPAPVKTDLFREYVNRNLPLTEQTLQSLRDADNLMAYFSFDEPFDSRRFDMTQSLDAIYQLTHQIDGYHPVVLLYSSHIPAGAEYVTCSDILSTDPYWIPAGPTGRNTPNFVSKIVYWNDQRAEEFRKAVWVVPVAGYWSGCRKRGLTDAEQDCQNFLAVIHGAKGLLWFCYQTLQAPSAARFKPIIDKVKVIGNMAIQPEVRQQAQYRAASVADEGWQEVHFAPEREIYPDVQAKIFRDPQTGELALVAANSRYYPVTAEFAVTGLTGAVRRVFADKTLPVEDGVFREELEPFAVRVYRLGSGLVEPVAWTITSSGPEKIPPAETAYPNNARMDRKNKFPNPSFEQITVPGYPDYFYNCHNWTLDYTGTAKFGRNCVKITKRAAVEPPWAWLTWSCDPQHDHPTSYTWSFWAKGGKGGEKLWVRHAPSGAKTNIVVTADWQRYVVADVVIPARHRGSESDFGILLNTVGDVWVDGLQLELGGKVTDFEE